MKPACREYSGVKRRPTVFGSFVMWTPGRKLKSRTDSERRSCLNRGDVADLVAHPVIRYA